MSDTDGPKSREQRIFMGAETAEWAAFATGKRRRILLHTPELMQMESAFDEGISTTPHSHPHVQVSYVLEGSIRVTVGKITEELSAGGSFIVPAGVIHNATATTAVKLLDTFAPSRQDYLPLDHQ